MRLEKNSQIPLYLQIADHLATDIRSKRILPMERLPSEYEFTQLFDVSRVTVRQAIRVLVERGLVVSKQGKGIFVTGPRMSQELNELRGFYDNLLSQGYAPETYITNFIAPHPGHLNEAMQSLESICRFTRVYKVQGVVIAVSKVTMSCFNAPITQELVEMMPVYSLLTEIVKKKVTRASTKIQASRPTRDIATLMGFDHNQYLLQMDRCSYDEQDFILENTCFYIQPDFFAFHLDIAGPAPIASSIRCTKASDAP